MGGVRNASSVLVGKLVCKKSLRRPRCTLQYNVKMFLKGTGCKDIDRIHMP
jgi:hypothetical protein